MDPGDFSFLEGVKWQELSGSQRSSWLPERVNGWAGGVKSSSGCLGALAVLHWSLQALEEATPVDEVIVVVPQKRTSRMCGTRSRLAF